MTNEELIKEFLTKKFVEHIKEAKQLYDLLKPINSFDKFFETIIAKAIQTYKQEQK